MNSDPPNPEPPTPPRKPWTIELTDQLWRFRHVLVFEAVLGVFEAIALGFGVLNAVGAIIILPAGLLLYVAGDALRRAAAGRAWSFRFGMRHLMVAVVAAAVLLVMARELGWSVVLLPVLLLPPLVGLVVALVLSGRDRSQQDGLLAVLAMAAHRQVPLGPAVAAFGGLCRGAYQGRVERLASRLEAGASLPEALDAVPGTLPRGVSAVARVGWDSGTLALALDEARAARRREAPAVRAVFGYPLVVVFALCGGLVFLAGFAAPRLRSIVREYDQDLPTPRRTSLDLLAPLESWLASWAPLGDRQTPWPERLGAGAMTAVGLFALVVGLTLGAWWLARRVALAAVGGLGAVSGRPGLAERLAAPDFRRDSATVLRALAVAFEGGRTVPAALASIDGRDLGRAARRRLRRAARAVDGGAEWLDALRRNGLVRSSDAAVLETAARAGNLGWALRDRADAADRREAYRLRAWGQVLRPVTIVGLGLIVLAFALFYFQPMVAIIQGLAEETP